MAGGRDIKWHVHVLEAYREKLRPKGKKKKKNVKTAFGKSSWNGLDLERIFCFMVLNRITDQKKNSLIHFCHYEQKFTTMFWVCIFLNPGVWWLHIPWFIPNEAWWPHLSADLTLTSLFISWTTRISLLWKAKWGNYFWSTLKILVWVPPDEGTGWFFGEMHLWFPSCVSVWIWHTWLWKKGLKRNPCMELDKVHDQF